MRSILPLTTLGLLLALSSPVLARPAPILPAPVTDDGVVIASPDVGPMSASTVRHRKHRYHHAMHRAVASPAL